MSTSDNGETFLVIGTGGNAGSEVTRALQTKGHVVRAPLRARGRALPGGVLALPGDLSDIAPAPGPRGSQWDLSTLIAVLVQTDEGSESVYKNRTTFLVEQEPGFGETAPGLALTHINRQRDCSDPQTAVVVKHQDRPGSRSVSESPFLSGGQCV